MEEKIVKALIKSQHNYFYSGATLNVNNRISALKKLKSCIINYEDRINKALQKDLGKSSTESFMCETGLVISEINYMLKNIRKFSDDKKVHTPIAQFYSKSFIKPSPYGVVLIMSPWNYPFLLTMCPLADAIAAGNTVILKPSDYSSYTTEIICKIINKCFDKKYVSVITGGRLENKCLLNEHFDYIFFTGSPAVGKEVMKHAASFLTPVTLELGGKSPCIVEKSADIKIAAKRIVFGKFLNCGQTCVAPDYILCDISIKRELTNELIKQIKLQFGDNPLLNNNYGKIINEKHFNRILSLAHNQKIIYGGKYNRNTLKIEPSIIDNVSFNDAVMQEEIFGPLLPVISYNSLKNVIKKINSMPHPLALYIFTGSSHIAREVITRCGFGGGCINDTVIHLATSEMGFGGFGESGLGRYHGEDGFNTFSHFKSIVDKKTWPDLPIRYQPYNSVNKVLIHLFLR